MNLERAFGLAEVTNSLGNACVCTVVSAASATSGQDLQNRAQRKKLERREPGHATSAPHRVAEVRQADSVGSKLVNIQLHRKALRVSFVVF